MVAEMASPPGFPSVTTIFRSSVIGVPVNCIVPMVPPGSTSPRQGATSERMSARRQRRWNRLDLWPLLWARIPSPAGRSPWPSANRSRNRSRNRSPRHRPHKPRRPPPRAAARGVTAAEEALVARAVKFGSDSGGRDSASEGETWPGPGRRRQRPHRRRGRLVVRLPVQRHPREARGRLRFPRRVGGQQGRSDRGHGLQSGAGRGARTGADAAQGRREDPAGNSPLGRRQRHGRRSVRDADQSRELGAAAPEYQHRQRHHQRAARCTPMAA